ncbi:hypothetical protein PoMZ_08101 [Pyricularia oryzae]|uniref:Uncharacterized protein n=1 Tax=Pyricularia oryzae TaxID=318829 RepID=A0A4P7NGS5_PYROR|nr:hypothetical protein PoMZ_08101 [Pyricularia oryzae]
MTGWQSFMGSKGSTCDSGVTPSYSLLQRKKSYSLLIHRIPEPVPGVKDGQVVDVLHVALAKVGGDVEALAEKVQRVQGLGLRLGDGRDVGAARQGAEPDQVPAGVLQQDPLRLLLGRGLVVDERPGEVALAG